MTLYELSCLAWQSLDYRLHEKHQMRNNGVRTQYYCKGCGVYFSETANTPLSGLRKPLRQIILVLTSLNEGTGINVVTRIFQVSKNSIYGWSGSAHAKKC